MIKVIVKKLIMLLMFSLGVFMLYSIPELENGHITATIFGFLFTVAGVAGLFDDSW